MGNMTIAIPEQVHGIKKQHNEIRWSEIARQAIVKKVREIAPQKDSWRKYALKHALDNWDEADELIEY